MVMSYADFSLDAVESAFGLVSRLGELFPGLHPVPVADWLRDYLSRGQQVAALVSEKARSEFLVVPILMAARELTSSELAIYSGQRLDVDPARGLLGECDYIVALTPPVPRLKAPLITVLEAKKGDLESRSDSVRRRWLGPVCSMSGRARVISRSSAASPAARSGSSFDWVRAN